MAVEKDWQGEQGGVHEQVANVVDGLALEQSGKVVDEIDFFVADDEKEEDVGRCTQPDYSD